MTEQQRCLKAATAPACLEMPIALLMTLCGSGAQLNLSAKELGCAFATLSDELASARAALRQCCQRGDA